MQQTNFQNQAIGVFDSGVGGLSVLNALRHKMPAEDFIYFADSGHAPYGERGDAYVIERSLKIAKMLVHEQRIKALVVACNTATAAAIHLLRAEFPDLILIGLEPALKPATIVSQTRNIAVLATSGTVRSKKFQLLRQSLEGLANFRIIACSGLASAIELNDSSRVKELCEEYLGKLEFGRLPHQIDTLVLGCTHYPFIQAQMESITGNEIHFVETGMAVANHTHHRLEQISALRTPQDNLPQAHLTLLGSGDSQILQNMAERYLTPINHSSNGR